MTAFDALPDSWTIWSEEDDGRAVLAYRPDVFDAEEFPPACLPTLYVTHGKRTRRPGTNPTSRTTANDWFVTLYLEPDVSLPDQHRFDDRSDAVACAIDLARQFDAGEIDYRDLYQVPRERYFDRLDELTGGPDDPDS
ncbi:DUF5820 family protein [Halosolutus halophilus]|uniref:DUF5820 family protein n=1 Tax=Halosolutus halophilus TaxID=1552990 RepID=UPI0022352278|nr:DUF5820 family protein [Halosolutus halophilus]